MRIFASDVLGPYDDLIKSDTTIGSFAKLMHCHGISVAMDMACSVTGKHSAPNYGSNDFGCQIADIPLHRPTAC